MALPPPTGPWEVSGVLCKSPVRCSPREWACPGPCEPPMSPIPQHHISGWGEGRQGGVWEVQPGTLLLLEDWE